MTKNALEALEPKRLWYHFENLTRIPRESGHEKAVSDFLVKFAKDLGLEVIQEPSLNVIIKKPAAKGYEAHPGVILQGHMDMVCVKEDDYVFDFANEAIPLLVEEDFIRTRGTSLGADNGIALAMAMAVLEDETLDHPPLQALFTVSEETGMDGVLALDPENIQGEILINLDSEEEGVLLASCAGGVVNQVSLPVETRLPESTKSYQIEIRGLMGGHSGLEIHKRRANAITVMGRLLDQLKSNLSLELGRVRGGEKKNTIPKRAEAVVVITSENEKSLFELIGAFEETLKTEYLVSDPGLQIVCRETTLPDRVYRETTTDKVIRLLCLIPSGVQTMSAGIPGLVESSNNLGFLEEKEGALLFQSGVRSSLASLKAEINRRIQMLCDLTGAAMTLEGDYPAWPYQSESGIRNLMQEVYREHYQKELKVEAIHAGLECGFLKEKLGEIDMVSMGPDMFDVHTPQEHVSISSTARVYQFLREVLQAI